MYTVSSKVDIVVSYRSEVLPINEGRQITLCLLINSDIKLCDAGLVGWFICSTTGALCVHVHVIPHSKLCSMLNM